jgi:hypothetical protein
MVCFMRLGRSGFPFLRQHTASHPHQRQQIFCQHRKVGYRPRHCPIIFLAVLGCQSQFFRSGLQTGDMVKVEDFDHMPAELHFLPYRFNQG